MIIVQLNGGLGNQLFQYAAGRAIAHRNKVALKLDVSTFQAQILRTYCLSQFNIIEDFASIDDFRVLDPPVRHVFAWTWAEIRKRWFPYHRQTIIRERQFSFDPDILKVGGNAYLLGYWQSEKYFSAIAEQIRREFTLKSKPNKLNQQVLDEIEETNSVSLHIRRGDYVSDPRTNRMHGCLGIDYYAAAVNLIGRETTRPRLFVFSDDIDWVKQHLKLPFPLYFIEHNGPDKDFEDLRLMSFCKYNIIANSSFSWWGAWLNANPEKTVLVPERWFNDSTLDIKDLIPESWIKIRV